MMLGTTNIKFWYINLRKMSSNTTQDILTIVQINTPVVWWLCSTNLHGSIHKIIRTFMGQMVFLVLDTAIL